MARRTAKTGVQTGAVSASTRVAATSLDGPQTLKHSSQPTSPTTPATTARTSDLITASSNGIPTSIEWGPAITASSLPTTQQTSTPRASNQVSGGGGVSHGAKITLIATTTIGGTLILAFLLYALWRRRRGATYTEIIRFRPHSSATILLSPGPRHPDFTALPIYRESRYSVRSSKRGSWLSFGRLRSKPAPSPTSDAFARGPWLHAQWKSANPPTPTRAGHPLSQVQAASTPTLHAPEMAYTRASSASTQKIRIKRSASEGDALKPWATVSAREVPSSSVSAEIVETPPDTPKTFKEAEDAEYDGRWSWTNSQAPPTPRMQTRSPTRRPSRASTGSLHSFRRVQAWIKPHSDRDRIPEEGPVNKSAKPRLPPLKNKASKPILAPIEPKATRRLSKKSGPSPMTPRRPRRGTVSSAGESSPGLSLPLQRN